MTTSTDGIICFGIMFEEGYNFSWDYDIYNHDIEDWWLYTINGYKEPFKWEYSDDRSKVDEEYNSPEHKKWMKHKKDFEKDMTPIPIELVRHCSGEYTMYIIAIKGTYFYNRRGYPESFDPKKLTITKEQNDVLIKFCKKYCMPINDYDEKPDLVPKWYLCSYWG